MLLTDITTAVEAQARATSVTATLNATTPAPLPPYSGMTFKQARAQMRTPPPEAWLRKLLWSVLDALRAEAAARNTSLQQHMYDILRARHLARQGRSYLELLWTPTDPMVQPPTAPPEAPPTDPAGEAASAWLDLLDDD